MQAETQEICMLFFQSRVFALSISANSRWEEQTAKKGCNGAKCKTQNCEGWRGFMCFYPECPTDTPPLTIFRFEGSKWGWDGKKEKKLQEIKSSKATSNATTSIFNTDSSLLGPKLPHCDFIFISCAFIYHIELLNISNDELRTVWFLCLQCEFISYYISMSHYISQCHFILTTEYHTIDPYTNVIYVPIVISI